MRHGSCISEGEQTHRHTFKQNEHLGRIHPTSILWRCPDSIGMNVAMPLSVDDRGMDDHHGVSVLSSGAHVLCGGDTHGSRGCRVGVRLAGTTKAAAAALRASQPLMFRECLSSPPYMRHTCAACAQSPVQCDRLPLLRPGNGRRWTSAIAAPQNRTPCYHQPDTTAGHYPPACLTRLHVIGCWTSSLASCPGRG